MLLFFLNYRSLMVYFFYNSAGCYSFIYVAILLLDFTSSFTTDIFLSDLLFKTVLMWPTSQYPTFMTCFSCFLFLSLSSLRSCLGYRYNLNRLLCFDILDLLLCLLRVVLLTLSGITPSYVFFEGVFALFFKGTLASGGLFLALSFCSSMLCQMVYSSIFFLCLCLLMSS